MKVKKTLPSSKSGKKVFIVDDHPIMRQGIAQLINREPDLKVCGEANGTHEALEIIPSAKPDLVLADITLPDKSGLELLKDIVARHPGLPVLVVSMHDESLYAERVLRAGGRGYLMKKEGPQKLVQAIRQVLSGKIYVSEAISSEILEIFSAKGRKHRKSPVEQLTDREFEIFQLLGQGSGTHEIAEKLHISLKTVEVHRTNIRIKLGLKTAQELLGFAIRWMSSPGGGDK